MILKRAAGFQIEALLKALPHPLKSLFCFFSPLFLHAYFGIPQTVSRFWQAGLMTVPGSEKYNPFCFHGLHTIPSLKAVSDSVLPSRYLRKQFFPLLSGVLRLYEAESIFQNHSRRQLPAFLHMLPLNDPQSDFSLFDFSLPDVCLSYSLLSCFFSSFAIRFVFRRCSGFCFLCFFIYSSTDRVLVTR